MARVDRRPGAICTRTISVSAAVEQEMGAFEGLRRGEGTVRGEHDVHQGIERRGGTGGVLAAGTSMAATVSCGQEAESAPGWGSATTKPRSSNTSPRRCQEAGTVTQRETARTHSVRCAVAVLWAAAAGLGVAWPGADRADATPRPARRTTAAMETLMTAPISGTRRSRFGFGERPARLAG